MNIMKNIYKNIMKTKYGLAILLALIFSVSSCDKGFEEININPISPAAIDPVYQLVDAQRLGYDHWHYEAEIAQQVNILIGGQEEGGGRNSVNLGNMTRPWDSFYPNQIKNTVNIIHLLKDKPERSNLYNMARIMKALAFQTLVDTYGDVPYFDAGKAYIAGINLPKYDPAEDIYTDLVKELTEAVDALDASKDLVKGEMYFAGDIARWKRFGNSLLLRIGMRYTKYDEAKARTIVATATSASRGGVMLSNADNVVVKYNSVQTSPGTGWANNSTKYNWYVGKPLIDFYKNNLDPRAQYLTVRYGAPESADGGSVRDTVLSRQVGAPFGFTDQNIAANDPNYPGKLGGAFLYSQFSRQTLGRVDAWMYFLTYSQTSLLMAEATVRGYISGTPAQTYYEAGIRANMTQEDMYSTVRNGASPISNSKINAYLARPNIAYNAATALKQINEQYWASCVMIWPEAWFNFRRSGYPQLAPLNFPGEDPYVSIANGYDGFIHRLMYTSRELSANKVNVEEAIERMGGDNFSVRVFWDKR